MDDIARILRRDCPREDYILECCRTLPNTHDNLWPLDGTEDPEALQARWNRWNGDTGATSKIPMSKRRKISHEADEKLSINHTRSKGIAIINTVCSIGSTTTMQNSSRFTLHTESGFISAAAQLQEDVQERQKNQVIKITSKGKKGSLVSAEVGRTPLAPGDCLKASYHTSSQGSLINFFGKETSDRTPQGATTKSGTVAVLEIMGGGGDPIEHHGDRELPGQGTTLRARAAGPSENIRDAASSRRPLASIPSALGNHKLRPTNKIGRPCLPTTNNDQPSKPYVFLSSSPPPLEIVVEKAEAKNEDHLHSMAITGKAQLNVQMENKNNHVRPAATFHTTSVAQVQAALNIHKKTLGVRRSMTGWANRARKGFSVPSKADDKT